VACFVCKKNTAQTALSASDGHLDHRPGGWPWSFANSATVNFWLLHQPHADTMMRVVELLDTGKLSTSASKVLKGLLSN